MKGQQIVVRVTNKLKDDFGNHCLKKGYSPSKRLRVLIENDIKDENYGRRSLQDDKPK